MELNCRFCLEKPEDDNIKMVHLSWDKWPNSKITSIFEEVTHSKVTTAHYHSFFYLLSSIIICVASSF